MCDISDEEPADSGASDMLEASRLADLARMAKEAEEYPPEYMIYSGPVDGVTGPFCAALAGLAIPYRYLKRMTNGRGRPVLEDVGGYRCRHNLSAAGPRLLQSMNIPIATDEQIEAAARVAGRQRRVRELRGLK